MKKKLIIIASVVCITGILSYGITKKTYAKYSQSSVWNYYLKSQNFYFESDTLSRTEKTYNNTSYDGGKVMFDLRNSQNNNLITDTDITYQVKCQVVGNESLTCKVNGQDLYNGVLSSYQACSNTKNDGVDVSALNKTECELKGYTYKNSVSSKELYFEVIPKSDAYKVENASVVVTAESISPYRRVLSAKYNLVKHEKKTGKITHSYKNYTDDSKLLITNSYKEEKCVTVEFDNTNKKIDLSGKDITVIGTKNDYVSSVEVKIAPESTKVLTFYDNNDKQDNFKIIELTNCK